MRTDTLDKDDHLTRLRNIEGKVCSLDAWSTKTPERSFLRRSDFA